MHTHFFIEFRLRGYARKYEDWVKKRAYSKARELKENPSREQLPHITLYGPAITDNKSKVIMRLIGTFKNHTLVQFKINGFSRFDNKDSKIIYLDVDASPNLQQLRGALSENLRKDHLSKTQNVFDSEEHYKFHSTIIKFDHISGRNLNALYDYLELHCRLNDYDKYSRQYEASTLNKLADYIRKQLLKQKEEERSISQYLLRVTALGRGNKILAEYDLVLKKLLNRQEALSSYWWRKTINEFRKLKSQYQ